VCVLTSIKCRVAERWSIVIVAIPALIGAEDRVGAQDLDLRSGTRRRIRLGRADRKHHGGDLARAMLGTGLRERLPIGSQQAGNANH
jgi:hypothetical protein